MTAAEIITAVVTIIKAAQELAPAAEQAIEDFRKLFSDGNEPTQADIDALIDQINANSTKIQALS